MKEKNERTYVVASQEYQLSLKLSEMMLKLVIFYTTLGFLPVFRHCVTRVGESP